MANLLLDLAELLDVRVTNLALQKLLYFSHAHFLIRTGRPLVTGYFEAWKYGPVHPGIYQAFKAAGKSQVQMRAVARNVMTGVETAISPPSDPDVRKQLVEVLSSYGRLTPGRLVDISHAPKGPWAHVANKARTSVSLGLRISDSVTLECFKFHKVSVGAETRSGEPDEDSPLVGDGLGALLRPAEG